MLRLSITFIFLLFISCGKDGYHSFSMLGKWQLTEIYDGHTAWGGCSCWEATTAGTQHTVEFTVNGTYRITPSPISSVPGCTGEYERKNDSTLVWGRCGTNEYEAKTSYADGFLLIEERLFAGLYIYKYKRLR